MITTIRYFFALLFAVSAVGHLLKPSLSDGFIPEQLPRPTIQVLAFVVEILLAIALLVPKTQYLAAWGTFVLMIVFLPLHVIDAGRARPVIGTPVVAYVRIAVQFLFIYMAWRLTVAAADPTTL